MFVQLYNIKLMLWFYVVNTHTHTPTIVRPFKNTWENVKCRNTDWRKAEKVLRWPFIKPQLWLQIRLRLAWRSHLFWQLCMLCVYTLRASDERMEPEAESKAEAVVSKRASDKLFYLTLCHIRFTFTIMLTFYQWIRFTRHTHNSFMFKVNKINVYIQKYAADIKNMFEKFPFYQYR